MLRRLGLASAGADMDALLIEACIAFLRASDVGYDRFFFDWYGGPASAARALAGPAKAAYAGASFEALPQGIPLFTPGAPELLERAYSQGDARESLFIDEIESIWEAIAARDDWSRLEAKVAAIRAMGAEGALSSRP